MWLWGRKKSVPDADGVPARPQIDLGGVVPARWSDPHQASASKHQGLPESEAAAKSEVEPAAGQQSSPLTEAPAAPAPTRQQPRAPRRFVWIGIKWATYCAMLAIVAAGFWLAGNIFYYTLKFPDPLALGSDKKTPVLRILARDGSLLAERGTAHPYMPLALLPRHVVDAVVAIEDRRFFNHWGIDPTGLLRATFVNMRAGRFVQGGSTLTQQLAKNMFLSPERTMTRKLDELVIAAWLESRLTKEEILELYLNRVYFGGGAYGIEAAAQLYFDKSARAVTVAEAAVLAGLLKAPSRLAPTSNPGLARARGRIVLVKMRETGAIDENSYAGARQATIRFAKPRAERTADANGYAVDFILDSLPDLIQGGHGEVIVETTIDAGLQSEAHARIARMIGEEGKSRDATQAAMVVLDAAGGVRALVGGVDYGASQFNRAVKARRQPGSTFKPFVYLTALENGMTPDTITYDLPISIDGWAPRNANGQYTGAITLRDALARSINTVAVRLTLDAGPAEVAATAQRLGIAEDLVAEPSIALGTSEASLLELTSAYAVFAADGRKVVPHVIDRIRTTSGRVLFARAPEAEQRLVSRSHVAAMNDMLNAALVAGTGHRAGLTDHPAAGKTGTSQDFRDAWFIGYSAHLTAGVWVGNDRGTPMQRVSGGSMPAKVWRAVMSAAHRGLEPLPLPGTAWEGTRMSRNPAVFRNGRSVTARRTEPLAAPPLPSRKQMAAGVARTPTPVEVSQAPRSAPPPRQNPRAMAGRVLRPVDRSIAKKGAGQRLVVRPPATIAGQSANPPVVDLSTPMKPRGPQATPHPVASLPANIFLEAAKSAREPVEPFASPRPMVASTGFDAEDIRRRLGVSGNRQVAEKELAAPAGEELRGMMSLGAAFSGR